MLLRNSISHTKKFFKKTLKSFKSLFSDDHYQRLPQTPPYDNNPYFYNNTLGNIDHHQNMNIQTSYKDLDRFYTDFTNQWEYSDKEIKAATSKRSSNMKHKTSSSSSSSLLKKEKESLHHHHQQQQQQNQQQKQQYYKIKNVNVEDDGKRQQDRCWNYKGTREERSYLLAEKLKELEMIDMSNVDHLLDIEEVLHYYSRLTCSAYLDIVDKFFMELYAEFLAPSSTSSSHIISSRPRLRSVRS